MVCIVKIFIILILFQNLKFLICCKKFLNADQLDWHATLMKKAILDDDLTLCEELGRGEFGSVCKGELRRKNGISEVVACKMLRKGRGSIDTEREAKKEALKVL